jgi:hypothetical protein
MEAKPLNSIHRSEMRWAFCLALYYWGEYGASEQSLMQIARDMKYLETQAEIREVMLYLQGLGFCTIEKRPDGSLWAQRTPRLVDLCEYNCPAPESIARPEHKWW